MFVHSMWMDLWKTLSLCVAFQNRYFPSKISFLKLRGRNFDFYKEILKRMNSINRRLAPNAICSELDGAVSGEEVLR